jgi:ethanolamine utilization microcompartment shell protein EutS
MLTIQVIRSPSKGTIRILSRKIHDEQVKAILQKNMADAVGLIQGPLAEMIVAGNIAEKAANVEIAELMGNCPQHITVIGIFGETSAVLEAAKAVKNWADRGGK